MCVCEAQYITLQSECNAWRYTYVFLAGLKVYIIATCLPHVPFTKVHVGAESRAHMCMATLGNFGTNVVV